MKVFMEEYGILILTILVIGLLITIGIVLTKESSVDLKNNKKTMQDAITTEMGKVYTENGLATDVDSDSDSDTTTP